MEKSNKGLKVTIVLLILIVLGLGGYIAYDKLYAKEDKRVETKDNVEIEETKLTSDERYAQYLKNVKTALEEHFKKIPNVDDDELMNLDESEYYNFGTIYGKTSEDVMDVEINYVIYLGEKSLYLSIGENYETHKIADNVLQFFNIEQGNAGYNYIYYITTDGNLYMVNYIKNIVDNDWKFKKEEIKLAKNIVNVVQGSGGTFSGYTMPILIDIDGNMYIDNDSSLEKLN